MTAPEIPKRIYAYAWARNGGDRHVVAADNAKEAKRTRAREEEYTDPGRCYCAPIAEYVLAEEAEAALAEAEALREALRKVQVCCQYTGTQQIIMVACDVKAIVEGALAAKGVG